MTDPVLDLLARLADGEWHGGPALSAALDVSRAAVWKQVEAIRSNGLPVESDAQRGYRLAQPIELLNRNVLQARLGDGMDVRVLPRCDSTNHELAGAGFAHRRVVLAEWQSAGRGRRGRSWISPPAAAITLSFGYRFRMGLPRMGALSLVAGIACADALEREGVSGVGLKWPNDLVLDRAKLGGLLVELQGAGDGPCNVVVGVGINAWLPSEAADSLDQRWIDLGGMGPGPVPRNRIAAALINRLDQSLARFEADGFEPFRRRWDELDILCSRPVSVIGGDGSVVEGIADGISNRGELRVRTGAEIVEFGAGEVSVRGRG